MLPFARSGWFCLACALAALFPLGCTPNLEKNEHFAQEKARLDRVDEDLKNTRIEVTKLSNEVGRLSSEMAALKKGVPAGGVPSDVLDGLTQRLTTLEGQVRSLANAPKVSAAAPKSAAADSEAEETEAPTPTSRTRLTPSASKSSAAKSATAKSVSAKSAPSPKGQVALTVKGSRNRAALASRAGTAATPKKTASTARRTESAGDSAPSGFYHQVTGSDTIASIAGKYGVSSEAIIKANGLSASNPRLFSGTSLYIPKRSARE